MADAACERNWYSEAIRDAIDTIDYFEDDVIRQLEESREISSDLFNDYPNGDEYHHSSHTDKSYRLLEAAHLLTQLVDYEENDSGLWEGIEDPERALEVKASYTYGNAVLGEFQDLVKELNSDFESEFIESEGVRRGPKEWRPRKKQEPKNIKEWLRGWLKERKTRFE